MPILTLCHAKSADVPVLMQLSEINLDGNSFVGTLPNSWSTLVNVGFCQYSLYLLAHVAPIMHTCIG